MRLNAGKKFSYTNSLNQEKSVQIYDGTNFFHQYLFPLESDIKDHFELKTIALVGGMGSGKSSQFRFLVEFIRNYWNQENVSAVLTDNVQLAMENISERPYQVFIVDDAISKQDSRRSMSDENVTATQQFMIIRHIAKEIGFGGVIYVIWAFQDPSAIDKRFRNTCDVTIFKQYYIEYAGTIRKLIKDQESIDFLKHITEMQAFNDFSYRSYGVGYTKWGSVVNIKTPYVAEEDFEVEVLDSSLRKDKITEELIKDVIDKDLINEPTQLAYGYLYNVKNDRPELEVYNFNQTDFQRILWRAKASAYLEGEYHATTKEEEYLYQLLKTLKTKENLGFDKMEKKYNIPHSFMQRLFARCENG